MAVVASYLGTTEGDTWPATVISVSVDIGAAEATRQIVGVVRLFDSTAVSGTFAGVAATLDVQQAGPTGTLNTAILRASVPTGSGSQTHSITCTPHTGRFCIDWYSVTGAVSTLVDTGSTNDNNPLTINVDGAAGGLVIAGMGGEGVGPWSLVGFDFVHPDTLDAITCASGYEAVSSTAPVAVTDNAGSGGRSLAAISFAQSATVEIEVTLAGQEVGVAVGSVTLTAEGVPVGDSGGSGNRSAGNRRRRNINDDPDRFAELLKEWRAKKEARKSPDSPAAIASIPKATEAAPDEEPADALLEQQIRRIEAAHDRSMAAYEAVRAKGEHAKVEQAQVKRARVKQRANGEQANAEQAIAARARQSAIEQEEREAAIEQEEREAAIEREEQARLAASRQLALESRQLALEQELARLSLAYEGLLDDMEIIMLTGMAPRQR